MFPLHRPSRPLHQHSLPRDCLSRFIEGPASRYAEKSKQNLPPTPMSLSNKEQHPRPPLSSLKTPARRSPRTIPSPKPNPSKSTLSLEVQATPLPLPPTPLSLSRKQHTPKETLTMPTLPLPHHGAGSSTRPRAVRTKLTSVDDETEEDAVFSEMVESNMSSAKGAATGDATHLWLGFSAMKTELDTFMARADDLQRSLNDINAGLSQIREDQKFLSLALGAMSGQSPPKKQKESRQRREARERDEKQEEED